MAGGVLVVVLALLAAVLVLRAGVEPTSKVTAKAKAPPPAVQNAGAVLADTAQAEAFVAGATSDIAAVTSYDYRKLEEALSAGTSVTTGAYQQSYRAALQGEVGDTARRDRVVQTFDLLTAGIGRISANGARARVLIFGVETVRTGAGDGSTRTNPVTLTATIDKRGSSYLISALEVGTNAGLPPGSDELAVAAEAGREQVLNVLSYRRDHFDADHNRALAGAVEPLRSALLSSAADTEQALLDGKYDLTGVVTAIAVQRASGDTVELLVAATGTKIAGDGVRTELTDGRYAVTVVRVAGVWRVSQLEPVIAS